MSGADDVGARRVFLVGGDSAWVTQLAEGLRAEVLTTGVAGASAGDVVVLDAVQVGRAEDMPFRSAFAACRHLKRDPRVLVFVVIAADDPFGAEIARFCLADGVLLRRDDGAIEGFDRISERVVPRRERQPIDALLARLENAIDPTKTGSILQRMLAHADEVNIVEKLTDPETGLFDGPFAGFKLDEELKRARRFHQPLSLVLLSCEVDAWPGDPDLRQMTFAEIASIFLNECRDIDVLARFTESVFLFLLPGTGTDGATIAARRIVEAVRARRLSTGVALRAVAGVATVPHPYVRDRKTFLALAEAALEDARSSSDGVVVNAP